MALKQVEDIYNNAAQEDRDRMLHKSGVNRYQNAVCKGAWEIGTACGHCERCEETRPGKPAPKPTIDEIEKVARWCGVMGLELAALHDGELKLVKKS